MCIFNENKVEYLVVGGYAVAHYGYVRATNDIDIWVNNDIENVSKIIKSLVKFGFSEKDLDKDIFTKDDQIIRMGVPPFRIELLTGVSGINFNETYPDKNIITIDDISISIIDLKNLKKNKKASGRHKDLDDLENL